MKRTSIGVTNETKERLEPLKEASDATNWDDFINRFVAENLNVDPEDLDEYAAEHTEQVEQTRATAVALLEAIDETDMVDEALEIIRAISQQDMLAQNAKIVDHLINKADEGGDITEMDRLLARVVMETEGARDHESPAAEIARGLFTNSTTAERTATTEATSTEMEDIDGTVFSDEDDVESTQHEDIEIIEEGS